MIVSHLYYLLRATAWLLLAFWRASVYFKKKATADLNIPPAVIMSSKQKRRLKHYFYGTTYLSIVFCSLRQKTRSRSEKIAFTNLSALAYFFDDLVDNFGRTDNSGVLWQDNPEVYGARADGSGLALHFLHNIYDALPSEDLQQFRGFMHRVFNVETAGRQQHSRILPEGELRSITAEKGGASVLMFRRVLSQPLTEAEENALFRFGALIQLCDDIFDVWFDRSESILTVPLQFLAKGDLAGLKAAFELEIRDAEAAFKSTHAYPVGQRRTAWAAVQFIISITRVALKRYEILQKKGGTLPLDDRAAMVTDMENWLNRLRATYYLIFVY